MRRPPTWFHAIVAALLLARVVWFAPWWLSELGYLRVGEWRWLATYVVAVSGVGRVALALLPPGRVGSHALAELPATCATSFAFGAAVLSLEHAVFECVRIPITRASIVVPWVVVFGLLLIRHAKGAPRPIVSNAPDVGARRTHLGWLAVVIGCVWLVSWAFAKAPPHGHAYVFDSSLDWWGLRVIFGLTAAILIDRVLCDAGRSAAGRSVFFLLVVSSSFGWANDVSFLLGVTAATTWWHLADRRALWLSLIAFACSWSIAGVVGLTVLVFGTRRPDDRRRANALALVPYVGTLVYVLLDLTGTRLLFPTTYFTQPFAGGWDLYIFEWSLRVVAMATLLWLPVAAHARGGPGASRELRAEVVALSIYVVVFLAFGVAAGDWYVLPDVAAPAVVVLAGLVWLRPEGAVQTADGPNVDVISVLTNDAPAR